MICPHCKADLKYRDRAGQKCGTCKKEFAFEPKTDKLKLHDVRFRKIVEKLSDGYTLRYTAGQLHSFAARKVVAAQGPFSLVVGVISAAVVAGFVGFILSIALTPFVGVPLALVAFLVGVCVSIAVSRKPFRSHVPTSAAEFERAALGRWRSVYGELPKKIVMWDERSRLRSPEIEPARLRALVVVTDTDAYACLVANDVASRLGAAVLLATRTPDIAEERVLDRVRGARSLPVFVLHDASPGGFLAPAQIADRFGLDARRVLDIGLRPRDATKMKLMKLAVGANPDAIAAVRAANAARGPKSRLTEEELAWLEAGWMTPLVDMSPRKLLRRVAGAIDRVESRRGVKAAPTGAAAAEGRARGFLTWPTH